MPNCTQCSQGFEVDDRDRQFLEKISPVFGGKKYLIPEPTLCPSCRSQRRLAFRNERNLYHRNCDFTGKRVITMFHPEAPYTVYDQDVWWSDKWDPATYARDFDFNKPFFEQFNELRKKVPRMSLNVIGNENSEYTNYALRNKDCYLLYTADYNEKCAYGRMGVYNENSFDFDFMDKSRFCYECTDVYGCQECFFCRKCESSSGLAYCYNVQSCHDCLFCINLVNKRYCILNKEVTKEEYEKKKKELFSSYKIWKVAVEKAQKFFLKFPRKAIENLSCENCTGNYLKNSRNSFDCYDSRDLEDCRYCNNIVECKDCHDWDIFGAQSELCYEMLSSAYHLSRCMFTMNSWDVNSNVLYSELMLGCENCFGCVSLRKKKYCILNKQYTQKEYEEMVPRIIEHMRGTGEWGQFYPVSMSPFAYNDSMAQLYFPLKKSDAVSRGWQWEEKKEKAPKKDSEYQIPDRIEDVKDDAVNHILVCEKSGRPFTIIPQELHFYRQFSLPIPRRHPDQRHLDRMTLRNPRRLWPRRCDQCHKDVFTTYAPKRPEVIYCEKCYLSEVY